MIGIIWILPEGNYLNGIENHLIFKKFLFSMIFRRFLGGVICSDLRWFARVLQCFLKVGRLWFAVICGTQIRRKSVQINVPESIEKQGFANHVICGDLRLSWLFWLMTVSTEFGWAGHDKSSISGRVWAYLGVSGSCKSDRNIVSWQAGAWQFFGVSANPRKSEQIRCKSRQSNANQCKSA